MRALLGRVLGEQGHGISVLTAVGSADLEFGNGGLGVMLVVEGKDDLPSFRLEAILAMDDMAKELVDVLDVMLVDPLLLGVSWLLGDGRHPNPMDGPSLPDRSNLHFVGLQVAT
jgi:hypothetical protein